MGACYSDDVRRSLAVALACLAVMACGRKLPPLPPIIEEMQAVRREARLLTPPLCAKKVQEEYLAYLDDGIKATVDWMGENVRGSQEAVDASKIHLDAFVAGLQQLVKSFGAP